MSNFKKGAYIVTVIVFGSYIVAGIITVFVNGTWALV